MPSRYRLSRAVNIADLRDCAAQRAHRMVFDYMDGCAEDEIAFRWSREAYSQYEMHYNVLADQVAAPGHAERVVLGHAQVEEQAREELGEDRLAHAGRAVDDRVEHITGDVVFRHRVGHPVLRARGLAPATGAVLKPSLSLEDAQRNEFVIVAALADLHNVETAAVAVAFSAMTRRRLSGGVVVSYTIAYDDEVAPTLTLDAAMFDQALTDAAAASGVADVFDAVETVAFGGSDEEAPVAAAAEGEETEVVSDAAFRPLSRGVLLVAAAAACLL